jgi:hypothetical protein
MLVGCGVVWCPVCVLRWAQAQGFQHQVSISGLIVAAKDVRWVKVYFTHTHTHTHTHTCTRALDEWMCLLHACAYGDIVLNCSTKVFFELMVEDHVGFICSGGANFVGYQYVHVQLFVHEYA